MAVTRFLHSVTELVTSLIPSSAEVKGGVMSAEERKRIMSQAPGLKQSLKRGQYPATVMADSTELGSLLIDFILNRDADSKDEKGNIIKGEITRSGDYILGGVDLESSRFEEGFDAKFTHLQKVAKKYANKPFKYSTEEYTFARDRDEFEGLIKRLTGIAEAHPDKSIKLLIPTQHHRNHWCLTQVSIHQGKVTHINVWNPQFTKQVSVSGFNKLKAIHQQKLDERRELSRRAKSLANKVRLAGQSNNVAELLAEQVAVNNELELVEKAITVFAATEFTHCEGKVQWDGFSCADQVLHEILNRVFPKGMQQDTLSAKEPMLAAIRDIAVDHPGLDLLARGEELRKTVVLALISKDPVLQNMGALTLVPKTSPAPVKSAQPEMTLVAPEKPAMATTVAVAKAAPAVPHKQKRTMVSTEKKILETLFTNALKKIQTVSEPAAVTEQLKQAILDAEWDNVVSTVIKNKNVQVGFDHDLAVMIDKIDHRYRGSLADDKLMSLARQALLVERAKASPRNAAFATLFAPKDLPATVEQRHTSKTKPRV